MSNYTQKTLCRACNSLQLTEILDLNNQPLANSYHTGEELETFPLKLNLCRNCYHLQLSVVVNPDLMFKQYLYVSGTSRTLNEYFENFAKTCQKYRKGRKKVLDIACNDGTQLDKFKALGWKTFGVDPAENLHKLSSKNHNVVCDYWNADVAKGLNEVFDVIVAQNVFAHTDDIHGFLQACREVTDTESYLFIQTSQANMILNNEFDTIYHEHLSFFNTLSMRTAANLNGFSLIDVFKTEVHGGSYVFVLRKGKHSEMLANREIFLERSIGLQDYDTYVEYAKKCKQVTQDLVKEVDSFRDQGYKIIGYGAAAKGNTFLNFAQLKLDYIADDNELKWDLLTPGMDIPIRNPECLKEEDYEKIVIVPLAWNFFREIRENVETRTGTTEIKFIKYFPEVIVL